MLFCNTRHQIKFKKYQDLIQSYIILKPLFNIVVDRFKKF